MAVTLTLDALQAQLNVALLDAQKLRAENAQLKSDNAALKAENARQADDNARLKADAARMRSECLEMQAARAQAEQLRLFQTLQNAARTDHRVR